MRTKGILIRQKTCCCLAFIQPSRAIDVKTLNLSHNYSLLSYRHKLQQRRREGKNKGGKRKRFSRLSVHDLGQRRYNQLWLKQRGVYHSEILTGCRSCSLINKDSWATVMNQRSSMEELGRPTESKQTIWPYNLSSWLWLGQRTQASKYCSLASCVLPSCQIQLLCCQIWLTLSSPITT